jgi:hypothetical protein
LHHHAELATFDLSQPDISKMTQMPPMRHVCVSAQPKHISYTEYIACSFLYLPVLHSHQLLCMNNTSVQSENKMKTKKTTEIIMQNGSSMGLDIVIGIFHY